MGGRFLFGENILANITVTGNAVADPEIRFTQQGKAVASFTVAENHSKKSPGGEWVDDGATFYKVTAWDALAENVTERIRKGSKVTVVGSIRNKPYETREGEKRDSFEVTADQVAETVPKFKPREGGYSNGAGAYG